MMKKIALFSDGTGNSSANPHKTNVWRVYQALDRSKESNQIAYYDNGVGTSAFTPTAILGLAFGWGLARNVRQIYKFVCQTYDPGDADKNEPPDKIYGFGFSRGAFTMRVAVALIADQGIIDIKQVKDEAELNRLIVAAYRQFRKKNFTFSFLSLFFRPIRDAIVFLWDRCWRHQRYSEVTKHTCKHDGTPLVNFIGVWDTVDAYGFPVDEMTRAWDKVIWPLTSNSRNLSKGVGVACHALALDEQRKSFEPMLWNESETGSNSVIKQIWFPGVHANVGGGYPDDALAYLPLNWILNESEKDDGLVYQAHIRRQYKNDVTAPQHDSRSGIGNLYRYDPRNLDGLCNDEKPGLFNWIKVWVKKLTGFCKSPLNQVVVDKPGNDEKSGLFNWIKKFITGFCEVSLNPVVIDKPKIHYSVFERIKRGGDGYAPINVPANYVLVTESGEELDITNPQHNDKTYEEIDQKTQVSSVQKRAKLQSYTWNKVRLRKLLQYLTLLVVIGFITFPYWPDSWDIRECLANLATDVRPWVGVFIQPINAIPSLIGKIPGLGFAENWAKLYQQTPIVFLLFILVIGGLLLYGNRVKVKIKSEMRLNWYHVSGKGKPGLDDNQISDFRKSITRFFTSGFYKQWINKPLKRLVEALAVFVFLCLLIAVSHRFLFIAIDGLGGMCEKQSKPSTLGTVIDFDPMDHCQAIGLSADRGQVYYLDFEVQKDWRDEGIRSDVYSWLNDQQSKIYDENYEKFKSEPKQEDKLSVKFTKLKQTGNVPSYMHLFLPFRRELFDDWYHPIIQIGNTLFDKYPLEPVESRSDLERPLYKECFIFKARRDGEMYIYLNDAVVVKPGFLGKNFYKNNMGKAKFVVSKQGCEEKSLFAPVEDNSSQG